MRTDEKLSTPRPRSAACWEFLWRSGTLVLIRDTGDILLSPPPAERKHTQPEAVNKWKTLGVATKKNLYFSFWSFPSGVATVNPLHPLLSHQLHVLFHYIHKSPLRSSSRLPDCQFQPHHPSTDIFTISSLFMSKPSQSGL